ncbi:thermonuclease family protein [Phormidium sp. LEGE 05292]|uniref:thermonuclease family protein n=1 Tax=[Phormidium] sp. LEGE 05292 TaxID=767427 RepID=UPI0018816B50|nr:thermonuclease family protein [Phormidium sp. LEGE 05292]MBE9225055.1 thermonuclease family protein [Phormidium sp. LEGE 05292]
MSRKNYKNYLFWQGLITLLLLLLISGIFSQFWGNTSLASVSTQSATVISVVDGDTLNVKMTQCRLPINNNSQQCRIRLACIDTPERGQNPFYQQAKDRLIELLPRGTNITVKDTDTTAGNRIVAEIFRGRNSINIQMVKEGKAVVYCKHLNVCSDSRNSLLSTEAAARKAGLGVWNPQQSWTQSRENHPCRN